MNSLFCRHNRFTADCPICSKDMPGAPAAGRRRSAAARSSAAGSTAAGSGGAGSRRSTAAKKLPPAQFRGPYASAGPYERENGERAEVRLERVPGGLRLGEWAGAALQRRAPTLPAGDLRSLIETARERSVVGDQDAQELAKGLAERPHSGGETSYGASPGRSGDMREELRVEALEDGLVRVGRWVLFPSRGWELQEAPTMYPPARYAEAIGEAARSGLLGRS